MLTRNEYIQQEMKAILEEGGFHTSTLEGSLSDEYYRLVENHIKEGNSITSIVYNSLTEGQKYHFNKHYNFRGDKVITVECAEKLEVTTIQEQPTQEPTQQLNIVDLIISEATGFENHYHDKVIYAELEGNKINFRIRNNVNMEEMYNNPLMLSVNVVYNVDTDKIIKMTVDNCKGSKKYNSKAKYNVEFLINHFIKEAKTKILISQREEKQSFYDECYKYTRDNFSDNQQKLNQSCFYLNQMLDAMNENPNITIDELKTLWNDLIEQIQHDTILFPIVETVEVKEETNDNEPNKAYKAFNRLFPTYTEAYQYCIESDFDPSYIEEISSIPSINVVELDLQYFANTPINTNISLSFNAYNPVNLSHNEWERDISKHNQKYFQLRENEFISLDTINELIDTNYNFWIKLINNEPYWHKGHYLIELNLTYINKGIMCYIPVNEYKSVYERYKKLTV